MGAPSTAKHKVILAMRRYYKRGKRWIEPWELAGAAKIKRGTCRYVLHELFHTDDAVFRRLSGKSWYGTAGYEYAHAISERKNPTTLKPANRKLLNRTVSLTIITSTASNTGTFRLPFLLHLQYMALCPSHCISPC